MNFPSVSALQMGWRVARVASLAANGPMQTTAVSEDWYLVELLLVQIAFPGLHNYARKKPFT